jgi:hypothetical protein
MSNIARTVPIHPFLSAPLNAAAYQTLCDCPRGSTRAWAAKAGWTHSKMRTFIKNLTKLGLARVEELPHGSLFMIVEKPVSTCANLCEPVSTCAKPYLKAGKKLDKVPRYAERKGGTATAGQTREPTPEEAQLIDAANLALRETLPGFSGIELHRWTIAAAEKILAKIPLERAVKLAYEAGRKFNPSQSGGDPPYSLGHPFLTRYVFNESRRIDRAEAKEEAKQQLPLPLMSVETGGSQPHAPAIASRLRIKDTADETPEEIAAAFEEFRQKWGAK